MDPHFTRNRVWVVIPSIASLGSIPYTVPRMAGRYSLADLGINGVYMNAMDSAATSAKRLEGVGKGFGVGRFYPAHSQYMYGDAVAKLVNSDRLKFCAGDYGQTPYLLDFEPADGSVTFWLDFLYGNVSRSTIGYRGAYGIDNGLGYMPGRVTDFTPEPFKATVLPVTALKAARFDVVAQTYFGDMSPADAWEVALNWLIGLNGVGFAREAIHTFIDGGRKTKPPIFYEGRKVRNLQPGTCIWSSDLLAEAGLI